MLAKPLSVAALAAVVVWAAPLAAQLAPPSAGGIVAFDYLLQRLAENRRVLVLAAHPDDEDTDLLALMSRGYGAAAAYLALSRGEGGQNLIGEELGIELGLLRSRELEAARAVDGAQQYFTRSYDFGFSRSLEETSRFWPPDSVLKDVVRILRRFRPHVMVTVFSGTARDGHGQHQAAGAVALPAFEAAGDSQRFAELGTEEGLKPWTPLKLYRSTRFDANSTTVELETGSLDVRTGRSIHQIAMESRSQHRSQDMGRILTVGPATSRLMLLRGRTGFGETGVERDIFDGIAPDTSWLAVLADSLRSVIAPVRLGEAAPALARALTAAEADASVTEERVGLIRRALAVAAGLVLDARAESETLVPGERTLVTIQIYNAGSYDIEILRASLQTPPGWQVEGGQPHGQLLRAGAQVELQLVTAVPYDDRPTQPYFLARPLHGAQYDWSDAPPAVRGDPFDPPILHARVEVTLLGARVVLQREVTYRYDDQATGEVRRPLRVVPAIAVSLGPKLVVWPFDGPPAQEFTVSLVFNGAAPASGSVRVEAEGWPTPAAQQFAFQRSGESQMFHFNLPRPVAAEEARVTVRAVATTQDGRSFDSGIQLVEYPHIRPTAVVVPATADVRVLPLRIPDLRLVGYVRGAADRVPEALQQLGLPLEIVDARALAGGDLARYDAIVIGSRAYEIDSALVRHNDRLLAYVREGGLLLVQYQQYQFILGEYAPYPLTISRPHDRVTDENAPVRLLQPDHPAFNVPNRVDRADWDGWPQERGLYFAGTWDDAYTALLEMQDPGMDPVRGGLLVAPYGEGTYVYTGLSFFRALPAGTPGAFKLFLNLLALNRGAAR